VRVVSHQIELSPLTERSGTPPLSASSSSAEESERMYSGVSSLPMISSGSRSRLKSKKNESRDYNQDQGKMDEKKDYS
jgi:hypothetical protein